jgi:hypothetical protein
VVSKALKAETTRNRILSAQARLHSRPNVATPKTPPNPRNTPLNQNPQKYASSTNLRSSPQLTTAKTPASTQENGISKPDNYNRHENNAFKTAYVSYQQDEECSDTHSNPLFWSVEKLKKERRCLFCAQAHDFKTKNCIQLNPYYRALEVRQYLRQHPNAPLPIRQKWPDSDTKIRTLNTGLKVQEEKK